MGVSVTVDNTGTKALAAAMRKGAEKVHRQMGVRLINKANRRIEARRVGTVITGNLGNSLSFVPLPNGGRVGTNLVYARIQQSGGEIRPKTVQNLAIPVPDALKRDKRWPRDFAKGAFFKLESPKGSFLIATGKELIPGISGKGLAFVLKPSVTIPDRGPFLLIEPSDTRFWVQKLKELRIP